MTAGPTSTFLVKLDAVIRKHPLPEHLQPKLLELFAVLTPGELGRDTADWLATYFDMFDVRDGEIAASLPHLLRSEVVIARCRQTPPRVDLFTDKHIRASVNTLLLLGSGPYGCSVTAIQRCAELGLLAPGPFFDEIERHLFDSAVGFRTVRTLERFAHIWRHRAMAFGVPALTNDYIRGRFVLLLRALAAASKDNHVIDPYPGAEWGITLARERLEDKTASETTRRWLQRTARDEERSPRERLYAAWLCLREKYLEEDIRVSMRESPSFLLREWAPLLVNPADGDLNDRNLRLHGGFKDVRIRVENAVDNVGVEAVLRDALVSLVFSALITPNGRLRRHLIEAVPAAGLVRSVAKVLVEVHGKVVDPSLRETILFLLSRLRQPTDEVMNLIIGAANQVDDAHLAQTALWAIGDTYWRPAEPIDDPRVPQLGGVPDLLRRAAVQKKAPMSGELTGKRVRMASAHALAILASSLPPHDGADRDNVTQALAAISRAATEAHVRRLADWGQKRLEAKPALVDPVSLETLERLEPGRPQE